MGSFFRPVTNCSSCWHEEECHNALQEFIWRGNLGPIIHWYLLSFKKKLKISKKLVTLLKYVTSLFKFIRDRWLIWLNQPLFTMEQIYWSCAKELWFKLPPILATTLILGFAESQKNRNKISTLSLRIKTTRWVHINKYLGTRLPKNSIMNNNHVQHRWVVLYPNVLFIW